MSGVTITRERLRELATRIQELYLADSVPWVIGYSGGKDSTATLQLVWNAIADLPLDQHHKPVHVISTDTLVEQPIVAAWVNHSLEMMRNAAVEQGLPIEPHRLTPKIEDSYWVNLIGRGYPAPRPTFRWCTSRLKIEPSNRFITEVVKRNGEAILVLGTRKAESDRRHANMNRHEQKRIRDWLSPNASLPNSLVFSPLEDWSNDDVWFYLMQVRNPWGRSNKDLMAMYRGASADNECPLVVDTTTPSCGTSRFGCWVCTLVSSDKSMQAMIQNDEEKAWMTPLLEFRDDIGRLNEIGYIDDRDHRDYRRMNGLITLHRGRSVHGPYTKERRGDLLRHLLATQRQVQERAPADIDGLRLIADEELCEIRRIWVTEKHEFDDALPRIYRETTGEAFPFMDRLDLGPFGQAEWSVLAELAGDDYVFLDLQASLLDVEQRSSGLGSSKAIIQQLEQQIRRCYYESEDDAVTYRERQLGLRGLRSEQMQMALTGERGIEMEPV